MTRRSNEPERAEGGEEWEREEDVDMSEPSFAQAAELRRPWLGSYDRLDRMTQRTISLKLEKRRDGSGILAYKFVAKTGNLIAPAGLITSGAVKVFQVTPRRRRTFSAEHSKRFGTARAPAPEERLVFESRWGTHTLRLVDDGKTIVEDNSSDGNHQSVYKWTRDEAVKSEGGSVQTGIRLW